ncbi:hypothetical protein AAMO2058_000997500 [Amorphochlora amoebiformis]
MQIPLPNLQKPSSTPPKGTFEWLAPYAEWGSSFERFLAAGLLDSSGKSTLPENWREDASILNVGCGYSCVHRRLLDAGFRHIVNSDINESALKHIPLKSLESFSRLDDGEGKASRLGVGMRGGTVGQDREEGKRIRVSWIKDDIRHSGLEAGTFGAVIDKSTLDFIVAESLKDSLRMLFHINRLLAPGGCYAVISMHPPGIILPLLSGLGKTQNKVPQDLKIHNQTLPPRPTAPKSTKNSYLYLYRKPLRRRKPEKNTGNFCENPSEEWIRDVAQRVEDTWEKEGLGLGLGGGGRGVGMGRLRDEFRNKEGKNQEGLELEEAYDVLFRVIEPIHTEYPFEDFVEDLKVFRAKSKVCASDETRLHFKEAKLFLDHMG